jgi:hypothetical protein
MDCDRADLGQRTAHLCLQHRIACFLIGQIPTPFRVIKVFCADCGVRAVIKIDSLFPIYQLCLLALCR